MGWTASRTGQRRAPGALDTLTELSVVREAGDRLPTSLQLKTRLSVFLVVLLAAVTIPIVLAARGADDGWRDRVLAVAGLSAMLAVGVALAFVRFYFGPVLRFAETTRRKLQNLTATLEQRVEERTAELVEANAQLRRTLEQNRDIQRQLMDASRRAGMAEVATSVLHNVGNVLNSVNVSAGVVIDTVQRSRLVGLGKAAELIREHEADWAQFLSEDEKGRKLPAYICNVAEAAAQERALMLDELASLQRNIDHIKTIVSRQQSQVKATLGVLETVVGVGGGGRGAARRGHGHRAPAHRHPARLPDAALGAPGPPQAGGDPDQPASATPASALSRPATIGASRCGWASCPTTAS